MSNIFFNMFKTSPKTVIKFLSNKSNYLEDLSIIFKMPNGCLLKHYFIKKMNNQIKKLI